MKKPPINGPAAQDIGQLIAYRGIQGIGAVPHRTEPIRKMTIAIWKTRLRP